ncbi:MAG: hypothetical protein IPK52_27060 [Chloroflexi bacterium]|nr:hypothetical protein [Chloroflexota bacterium]
MPNPDIDRNGGVGKTQLALRVAEISGPDFTDGVYFVPLAGLTSHVELLPTLAHALAVTGPGEIQDAVVDMLDRNILLILDNFEHISKAAPLVGELIGQSARLKIFITSRGPLNLGEEWVFPVAGMPLDCGAESASALFVRHARRSNPAFDGEALAGEIRELCQAVDGLPLAVELSAAWVRMLSPGEILARLRQDVGILAANQPDRPERQRSLKAVFEYSWSLLSDSAQQSLRGISVFRGPFHIKLAADVAGCTLATLAELIDFALVIRLPDSRYQIHPLLRQFSAEKLDEATMSIPTYMAHADAFSRYLVERAHLLAAGDEETLAEMAPAFEDIRAAVKWLIWSQQIGAVERLLAPLAHLCRFSGYVVDGVALIRHIELWSRQQGATDISQHARILRESLELAPAPRYLELTNREAEILRLITEGLSNNQIAEVLTVEISTVKKHVNNLFRKLKVTGREDAVLAAQSITVHESPK